ncbi:MAG TPA: glycosyl hydrolase family 28 protein [Verrucomicrobiae bacterium]|nr:glycosyl hydrolase family 28 protein [Verrucomicrobiae bacterium]
MTKHAILFLLATSLLASCATEKSSRAVFDITAYGAVDNPQVSSADAFRQAIAACRAAGGGTVRVPAGKFLTGPIEMVDNMTLQVDSNAVVLFETDRTKYPDITSRWEGLTENGPHPLIFANGLHHIAITGPGTFDGQGATWWANMDMAEHGNARPDRPIRRRPMLLQIKDCTDVRIDGPSFINSPFWAVHLLYSERIDVGHCRIINPPTSPNTDALNTDSCRHVVVHDCYADVGDDAFGIKSGRDEEGRKMNRPTEYVTYLRCHVAHAHSVCAIGSEESGSVRHVRFLDCDGDGTDNGIRIKSTRGRGGIVEDIVASHFRLHNVRNAIIFSLRYTKTPAEPLSERTPLFRDIHVDHVTARDSRNCVVIEGLEECPIQNVTLTDLDLSGTNGVTCTYAKNITFKNVKLAAQTNLFVVDHSENIHRLNYKELSP